MLEVHLVALWPRLMHWVVWEPQLFLQWERKQFKMGIFKGEDAGSPEAKISGVTVLWQWQFAVFMWARAEVKIQNYCLSHLKWLCLHSEQTCPCPSVPGRTAQAQPAGFVQHRSDTHSNGDTAEPPLLRRQHLGQSSAVNRCHLLGTISS